MTSADSTITAATHTQTASVAEGRESGRTGSGSLAPTKRLKVVLIAYAFPPFSAAGSARAAKVANALRNEGHSVHVITSRLPGEGPGPRLVEEGLTVTPVATLPHPRQVFVAAKRLLGRWKKPVSAAQASVAASDDGQVKERATWKRLILSLLLLPDDLQGFIPPAVTHVLRHVRGADLVYTTSPPATAHLVGLVLKLLTGVRWVTEFRDPWYPQRGTMSSRARDRIEGWLEYQCISRADHVIAVSQGTHDLLRARLEGRAAGRCAVVRNGIDELAPATRAASEKGPERILYLGTLYWKRNPRLFLRGLAIARRRLGVGPDELFVDFVGNCRAFGGESVEAIVRELGLDDVVRFHDWVPHTEAQRMLEDATLLLLLAQEQPIQVPNKLYEYLGTRKPILAVADDQGETARMLRAVGSHYVATELDDEARMADLLERALTRNRAAIMDPRGEAVLEEWTTERQMRGLIELLGAESAATRRHVGPSQGHTPSRNGA
jgi:glycosyltransferase involved in cell wall biosynthesis